jgi:hypothetical protein
MKNILVRFCVILSFQHSVRAENQLKNTTGASDFQTARSGKVLCSNIVSYVVKCFIIATFFGRTDFLAPLQEMISGKRAKKTVTDINLRRDRSVSLI